MAAKLDVIVVPAKDLGAAKAFYGRLLGVEPYADEPYYVGFRTGDTEVGLDPNGHANGMTGPVAYWQVADLEAALAELGEAGATVRQPATDVGGGKLIAVVTAADGNMVGLAQPPA